MSDERGEPNPTRDEDLKAAFAALRTQQPVFSFEGAGGDRAIAAARRRLVIRRRGRLAVVVAVLAAIASRYRPGTEIDFKRFSALTGIDPAAATWTAPSDFLLDVPGREFLESVPSIGVRVPPQPADVRPQDSIVIPRRRSDS